MTSALRVWHPVGYGAELTDAPRSANLLDERIVLWRDGAGIAHALQDQCVHPGTALSLDAVLPYREREEIAMRYKKMAGFDIRSLNETPHMRASARSGA